MIDTNKLIIELLEDVIQMHFDKESPNYNECGGEDDCQWCVDAKKVVSVLKKREVKPD